MSSPLLTLDGAVEADPPDDGIAAHYGSLVTEQRRLVAGEGFVDLSNRQVFRIGGPDRLTWLHALTTQDFTRVVPGQPIEAMVLSPQGRIEHAFSGTDDGEVFTAHTEPGAAESLLAWLRSMVFMSRVEISDPDPQTAVIGLGDLSWRFVSRDDLTQAPAELGPPAGSWAWEALRIEAGIARIGFDTDDKTIPNELGVLGGAVQVDKGCYRGQETVARVHNLGKPPRRLTRLLLDGSAERLPEPGAPIELGDRAVGIVGTSARHHELGPIALGLIKRNVDTAETVLVEGISATQEPVVDPEVGLHFRPNLR